MSATMWFGWAALVFGLVLLILVLMGTHERRRLERRARHRKDL